MMKNIISGFFSRGFVALSNFSILLLSAHYLGSAVLGQVSILILDIAIIQMVNEIYTGPALVYFIPKNPLTSIYVRGLFFTLAGTLLLGFVFYIIGHFNGNLTRHVLVLSVMITLNAFHNIILLAKEKIKAYNLLVFLQPLLMVLSLAVHIFILNRRDFNAYITSLYISFSGVLVLSGGLLLPLLRVSSRPEGFSLKQVLGNGFMNQLGNLAHTLSNRLNYYLLGSAALVGVYASSTSLIEGIWIISGSVSPIVLSHVANRRDPENNPRLALALAKMCFLLGLACVLALAFLPAGFFTFLLGKDFGETKSLMLHLAPGILCLSFSSIISHYFSGLGQQRILLAANVAGLFVTLCCAWPLISYFGLLGACYAANGAYVVQAAVLLVVFMKQSRLNWTGLFLEKIDWGLLRKQAQNK